MNNNHVIKRPSMGQAGYRDVRLTFKENQLSRKLVDQANTGLIGKGILCDEA
jgi:hypothetical protein